LTPKDTGKEDKGGEIKSPQEIIGDLIKDLLEDKNIK